jgi:hypothetical protein
VGQWGTFGPAGSAYSGLVRVDPNAAEITAADVIDLGSVYCSFDFEPSQGRRVAALTRDGMLHVIDVPTWTRQASIRVLPDGGAACSGSLAMGNGVAYLTEPAAGQVHIVPLERPAVVRSHPVMGTPWGIAAFDWRKPVE